MSDDFAIGKIGDKKKTEEAGAAGYQPQAAPPPPPPPQEQAGGGLDQIQDKLDIKSFDDQKQ
ncbi:MAG: hypothetical protein RDV48_02220 [Candidatus Eremiobacteraeota bacterium]|nr:hypothetical protein [Candidatus Eremiobacteraeota bacterium]